MVTSIVMYIICKHTKLKSLANQSCFIAKKKRLVTVDKQEYVSITHDIACTCTNFNVTQYSC